MEKQFKAGDKVRALETDSGNRITKGNEYTVTRTGGVGPEILIYFEDDENQGGGVFAFRFELVEPQASYSVTTRYANGGYGVTLFFDTEQAAREHVREVGVQGYTYELGKVERIATVRVVDTRTVTEVA